MKPLSWKQIAIAALLVLFGIAIGRVGEQRLDPTPPAVAQMPDLSSGRILTLSNDGYFVTVGSEGTYVFLWYFERRGDKTKSKIYYVTQAHVEDGPFLGDTQGFE